MSTRRTLALPTKLNCENLLNEIYYNFDKPKLAQALIGYILRTSLHHILLGISGGASFFTYFPTTPSLIVLRSLFFRESILPSETKS